MNKNGNFKYFDYPLGINKYVTFNSIGNLQAVYDLQDLNEGVAPHDFISFEQNEYITSNPKPLYFGHENLGYTSSLISDDKGLLPIEQDAFGFEVNFEKPFVITGITVYSGNIIEMAQIEFDAIDENEIIQTHSQEFTATDKTFFYEISAHKILRLKFSVSKINEPYHFLKIFKVEFGQTRILDDYNIVSASLNTHFSVYGNQLEYNSLDLTLNEPENKDYFFQKKQPIDFIFEGENQLRFYVNNGERLDENTINLLAYNEIANLEDEFLGGIYTDYPLKQLLVDILGDADKYYGLIYAFSDDIKVSGYLPISTKRKAIQAILMGTEIRHRNDKGVIFEKINVENLSPIIFDESNIINKPVIKKNVGISSVTVRLHNFSKGTEEREEYHWFISTTEDVKINFSKPLHSLKFYEVTGVDEYGNDVVSEQESTKVTVLKAEPNYCIIRNSSSNKIVLIGKEYIESTVDFVKQNPDINDQNEYEEKVIDLNITSGAQDVCDLLYALYTRKNSINFKTFIPVTVGGYYDILGNRLNIKSVENSLTGIYEVEAV